MTTRRTTYQRFFPTPDAARAFVAKHGVRMVALDTFSGPFSEAHRLTYQGAATKASRPAYRADLYIEPFSKAKY